METIRRLAAELRMDSPRLSCAEVEGADSHPLAKAGILKPVEILKRWRCYACDELCFAEVAKPISYTDDSGDERWHVYCDGGGMVEVPSPYVAAIWDYDAKRMAETLRDLLKCPEARREIASGIWRLGQSGHKHIKPFNVAYMTRIKTSYEQAAAKTILSDLRTILIAGHLNADADLGGFRARVVSISYVLVIDAKHRLAVNTGTLLSLKQVMSMPSMTASTSQSDDSDKMQAVADDIVDRIGEKINALVEVMKNSTASLPNRRKAVIALVREIYAKQNGRMSFTKIVQHIRSGIARDDEYYDAATAASTYVTAYVKRKKPKNQTERSKMVDACWRSIATQSKSSYDKAVAARRNRLNADPSAPPGPVPILDVGI